MNPIVVKVAVEVVKTIVIPVVVEIIADKATKGKKK